MLPAGPVVGFSYLAAAELWNVARFPAANQGAEVFAIEQSIAADGPMVTAVLAALGVSALVLANNIGDDAHGAAVRQWLQAASLELLNLTPLAGASFAYIDCYELIRKPAVRAVQVCRTAGVPVLLNLGGSPLSSNVVDAACGHSGLIVQTNVADDDLAEAHRIAPFILEDMQAAWVIITAGANGALALSRRERRTVPAFRAKVRHTLLRRRGLL